MRGFRRAGQAFRACARSWTPTGMPASETDTQASRACARSWTAPSRSERPSLQRMRRSGGAASASTQRTQGFAITTEGGTPSACWTTRMPGPCWAQALSAAARPTASQRIFMGPPESRKPEERLRAPWLPRAGAGSWSARRRIILSKGYASIAARGRALSRPPALAGLGSFHRRGAQGRFAMFPQAVETGSVNAPLRLGRFSGAHRSPEPAVADVRGSTASSARPSYPHHQSQEMTNNSSGAGQQTFRGDLP